MIILSAGGKRFDWFEKRSQDEKIGFDAISDEQLKSFSAPVSVDDAELDVKEDENEVEVSEDIPGTKEDESLPSSGDDLKGRVADVLDDVSAVQEKLKDVADDVADVADLLVDEDVIDEVEIEIEDEESEDSEEDDSEVEVEVEGISEEVDKDSFKGEGLTSETEGSDEKEESDDEDQDEDDEKNDDALIVAGSNRTFAKLASLSPETKNQVKSYWKDVLGYDAAFVDLMIKDYKA